VIQSALFFILGFLSAGFLSLLIAPAIWRRAVALTRKRVEATVPLTMDEIRADKDRVRAEAAISIRRLEMNMHSLKEKAAQQLVDINRGREELKQALEERDGKQDVIDDLEDRAGRRDKELQRLEEQLEQQSAKLDHQEKLLLKQAAELEEIGRMYDEASFEASSRQIQMVAQEGRLEKLRDDVTVQRGDRKEAERKLREAVSESKDLREQLRNERKRAATLDRRVERLTTSLSDREEKLERRERELARVRKELRQGGASSSERSEIEAERALRLELERDVAALTQQLSSFAAGAEDADVRQAVARLASDRGRLEERLAVLNRENRKLRASLDRAQAGDAEGDAVKRGEGAVLREQIADLAAEVVHLTALLDEPDSAIRKALSGPSGAESAHGRPLSLADRIKVLQRSARSGERSVSTPPPEAVERDR
jgi:chromosome segregation ATPase